MPLARFLLVAGSVGCDRAADYGGDILYVTLKRFWDDDHGAEMIEWAVVTVVLLLATVPAILVMREGLLDMYRQVFDALEQEPPTDY